MSCYVIGDVHGSLGGLDAMLAKLSLQSGDAVYFIGDLVGKGDNDWEVLDRVRQLPGGRIILGNHDLQFLQRHFSDYCSGSLSGSQRKSYEMLRGSAMARWHARSDTLMVHAGIWPGWSLEKSLIYAAEVEAVLRDDSLISGYFDNFYGNEEQWQEKLLGWKRVRTIVNIFTRMRMLDTLQCMDFNYTGPTREEGVIVDKKRLVPWFEWFEQWPCRRIVFGHWAMLQGNSGRDDVINLDGGYVYGGELLAMNCDTGERYSVKNSGKTEKKLVE